MSVRGSMALTIGSINPFRYRGYYYDEEIHMYYLMSRYYDPKIGRFINPDDTNHLDYLSINGLNLYCYFYNNPINYKQNSALRETSISTSSLLIGASASIGGKLGVALTGDFSASERLQTLVGTLPDANLAIKYLSAKGIHTKFAYATNTRYMHPIMGGTWRWFGKSTSSFTNFRNLTQGAFRQILTGDARAGFVAIAKSVGGTIGLNAFVNLVFNFYENNLHIDGEMLMDTAIDTAIGVSSYYLAAGTMSIVTTGLLMLGIAMPGVLVVGGVVVLSFGFEWLIREIFDYHQ